MSLDLSYSPAEDGPTVRFLSALAAPVFPLLALLCCFLVELVKPGLGITAALQAPFFRCISHAECKHEFPPSCPFWIPSQGVSLQPLAVLESVTLAGAHALLCGRGLRHINLASLSTKGRPGRHLVCKGQLQWGRSFVGFRKLLNAKRWIPGRASGGLCLSQLYAILPLRG